MRLIERTNIGRGVHRSGWPDVMARVWPLADGRGVLLDDCVEASFLFSPLGEPHREPWVGIFHFPASIDSPLSTDRKRNTAMSLLAKRDFALSLRHLIGAVCLCDELAGWWHARLGVPTLALKHPTSADVVRWSLPVMGRAILQAGFHLRDTRAIFRIPPKRGWRYYRLAPVNRWQRQRDRCIKQRLRDEVNGRVVDLPRLDDYEYDAAMSSCVCLSEAWGAAACNVIVECVARGTPLLTTRRRAIEEYLGPDYPMYYERARDAHKLTDDATLLRTSEYLLSLHEDWLDPALFGRRVARFTRECARVNGCLV